MLTPDVVNELKDQVNQVAESMKVLAEEVESVREKTHINVQEDPTLQSDLQKKSNIESIFFDLATASDQEKRRYGADIAEDLALRGINPQTMSLQEQQDCLKKQLVYEWRYHKAKDAINHSEYGSKDAMNLLLLCLPCILHLENRVGLKIITMAIRTGWNRAEKGELYSDIRSEKKRVEIFFADLDRLFQHQLLGNDSGLSQFRCPYNPTANKLDPITLDNKKTRKVMGKIASLLALCIRENDRPTWLHACNYYNEVIGTAKEGRLHG